MMPISQERATLVRHLARVAASMVMLVASAAQAQTGASAEPAMATARAVEGTVFVVRSNGRQALLTPGASLQVGDAINTTRNSTVRLNFTDGSETVVRPESTVVVQEYQFKPNEPSGDSLLINLIRGGLRTLTGSVGKRGNAGAYQLRAATATVGIRGTDYSVRLCQKDCAEESSPAQRNSATPVAARAVVVRGGATVSRGGAAPVPLTEGHPVYSGDTVETTQNAHTVLVFRDDARVTVNSGSRIVVADYAMSANGGSMLMDLLKGGLRVATGLIGKSNPGAVKIRTATATVGIRGTVFDLVCAPGASSDEANPAELGDMACEGSLFAQTREGTITLTGNQGEALLLGVGQSGRVAGPNVAARSLAAPPSYFQNSTTPLPESVPVNREQLFGVQASSQTEAGGEPGVFLTVHEGQVVLAQSEQNITLDAGESAFAGRAAIPVRLFSPPPLMDRDPFLSSSKFSTSVCRR